MMINANTPATQTRNDRCLKSSTQLPIRLTLCSARNHHYHHIVRTLLLLLPLTNMNTAITIIIITKWWQYTFLIAAIIITITNRRGVVRNQFTVESVFSRTKIVISSLSIRRLKWRLALSNSGGKSDVSLVKRFQV